MAFHRDKVQMINAFCTWHLVTGLFGEMQVFNHILKHRIWAQLDLFWTVPFSPNIESISKKKVGREEEIPLKNQQVQFFSPENPHMTKYLP